MGRFRGRGSGRDNENEDGKNKKRQIPEEKLKFSIGANQAENYQRLKKYMVLQVQTKYGAHVASILLKESETPLPMDALPRPIDGLIGLAVHSVCPGSHQIFAISRLENPQDGL